MNSSKCFKSIFYFALWHKMDNDMLRLLTFFFLGMFCNLMFCKLQNMRWPSNVTSIIFNRGAWSEWLNPPYIYGTHWHNVISKGTPLIKDTTSQKDLTTYIHYCYIFVFWSTRSSRLQMFFKIDVLKNVPIFTGKYLCWSLFLIKLQAFSSEFY